ncbi:MAG: TRM11 family methyltransferase [Methanothrix sp.]|jgi:tRNA (guanine10-N2)-dimethyltransferase|uniref:methyltransferase domain-containing protein n=1 Tax=Methanothrix sp. TaxID=90426 RepID=UPI00247ECC94|nr:TRM11 family methyltransferase [Methanothrix sp.]
MSKLYAFELSGEHPTVPRSEALSLLRIHAASFREVAGTERCLLVDADGLDHRILERRLAMTHRILEVLKVCDASPEGIEHALRSLDLPRLSYRVRASRLGEGVKSHDLERMAGRVLHAMGYRADLENPEMDIRAIVSRNKVVFGYEIARPDRGGFERRRPHLKPFFYPGVLMPRMARALVNIAMVRPGELLLDPFSGTAGILVEACLVGIRGAGVDVQEKLNRGARANLDGLEADLILGDARSLPFKNSSVDAVVTDTPYGRSAVIKARSKDEMLSRSFEEMHRVLKAGRRAVVVTDSPAEDLLRSSGFRIVERHSDRVHRSLTRYIHVCEKPADF